MAMDLSIHNTNKDNNNDLSVVDLSLGRSPATATVEVAEGKLELAGEEKLHSLLPQLDIAALNILCLARLQETAAALTGGTVGGAGRGSLPGLLCGRRTPLPAHLATSHWLSGPGTASQGYNRRTHRCDYPDCDKVNTSRKHLFSHFPQLFPGYIF